MEIKVRDISINCEIVGQGKPIIMIHGYTPDHRLMKGCMEPALEGRDEYMRVYFDLPGMGKTKAASWITNSDIMLNIVLEFIEAVIPNQNFLLAGESYGGYLARGIVKQLSNRVDGLLMIGPLITPQTERRTLPERQVIRKDDALLKSLDPSDADRYSSIAVVQREDTLRKYMDHILPGLKLCDVAFTTMLRESGFFFSSDVDKVEMPFEKPTLVLCGRQDHVVGYEDAFGILGNYPRASYAVLDAAGHCLESEQDVVFNCLVGEWLDRVKEYTQQSGRPS